MDVWGVDVIKKIEDTPSQRKKYDWQDHGICVVNRLIFHGTCIHLFNMILLDYFHLFFFSWISLKVNPTRKLNSHIFHWDLHPFEKSLIVWFTPLWGIFIRIEKSPTVGKVPLMYAYTFILSAATIRYLQLTTPAATRDLSFVSVCFVLFCCCCYCCFHSLNVEGFRTITYVYVVHVAHDLITKRTHLSFSSLYISRVSGDQISR